MRLTLSIAVPARIADIRKRGGPNDLDWETLHQIAGDICAYGDVLQFGSERNGQAADQMTGLAHALAIISFVPGGIRFAGMHFEAA